MSRHDIMSKEVAEFYNAIKQTQTQIYTDSVFGQLYLDAQTNDVASSVLREAHLHKWITVIDDKGDTIFEIPPRNFIYDTTPTEDISLLLDMARYSDDYQPGVDQGDQFIDQAGTQLFQDDAKLKEQIAQQEQLWASVKARYDKQQTPPVQKTDVVTDATEEVWFDDDF